MKLRHEYKHRLSPLELPVLRCRLSAAMKTDPYAKQGFYCIRSLYFDNSADKALREKIDGVNKREKFRLRYYNGDVSRIILEKKSKYGNLCSKVQEAIHWEEAEKLTFGLIPSSAESSLLGELGVKMKLQGLRPKTIVDYIREPFVFAPGNVRVTLDHHLRTAMNPTGFLEPDCSTIPAGEGLAILEVKWDQFLPCVIQELVQMPGVHTSSFSKYAACRIYG